MKSRLLVLSLAAGLSISADAGYKVTEIVGRHELRDAKGVLIGVFQTHAECVANLKLLPPAAAAGKIRAGTCKAVTHLDWEWNCDDAVKPALTTFKVLDPNGVVYSGPYCVAGETCTTPPDWQGDGTITSQGVEYTYTDVGGLRWDVMPDGSIKIEEYKLILGEWPKCWHWAWEVMPEPKPIADTGDRGEMPPLDPGALDGQEEP